MAASSLKRGGGGGDKRQQETPFYSIPENVRTSSQIINEARRSLRAVPIKRPYTPAGDGRHLFSSRGGGGGRGGSLSERKSRPPSVFSMGPGRYKDELVSSSVQQYTSRPTSKQRLSPIDNEDTVDITPATPYSSQVNVSTSTHSLHSSSSSLLTDDHTNTLPVLKTSTSSPTTSRRIKSAEKTRQTASSGTHLLPSSYSTSSLTNNGTIKTHTKDHYKDSTTDHTSPVHHSTTIIRPPSLTITDSNGSSQNIKPSRSQISQIWDTQLSPLLEQLNPSNSDIVQLCSVCTDIWKVLQKYELFGKALGVKRRNNLLQSVFRMLGHKEARLLLKLAKLILAMQVSGSNLLNVFKLVFSLSREDTNDSLFNEEEITVPLLTVLSNTDPHSHYEAMIYGLGCIKLLASNSTLREVLSQNECIQMMGGCIDKCITGEVSEGMTTENNKKHIADVLIQLIGGLRNLADTTSIYDQLETHCILQSLATVMEQYLYNNELVFNLSRLLSKLTLTQQCKLTVSSNPLYLSLLPTALTTHINNEDIVLRVCFILGNLSRDSTDISQSLCHTHSLLSSLQQVLVLYHQKGETTEENNSKTTDVLIKCVSLLANLSVHHSIAVMINSNEEILSTLLNILESFGVKIEELTINTLAALNNLSFYSQESILEHHQDRIIDILIEYLSPNSTSIMLESTRVLGNLTRQSTVRNIITTKRVDELLITLLDSKYIELVYSVCGILVNLMMDRGGQCIDVMKNNNGVRKLLDVLSHFGRQDWLLASLVCKVLWNYSEGLANVNKSFTYEELVMMYHLLEDYLDPITAFTNIMTEEEEGEGEGETQQFWEPHFVPVASDIIQKLNELETIKVT